jgi:hypothetical protein
MRTQPSEVQIPDVAEIRQIVRVSDPVIRNLQITGCYHRLALALTARIGQCANWCTFATWASRQAGRTIRGEDFLEKLARETRAGGRFLHPVRSLWRMLLRHGLFSSETRLGRLVREIHSPFDAFERASDAVARGNLRVFEEIGFEFARYLQECPKDSTPDSIHLQAFLSAFRTGDPPGGQRLLREAFTRYQQQPPAEPASRRAQRIFLANLEIGLHEQTRLQPEIRAALESGPDMAEDLGARALRALFPKAPFIIVKLLAPLAAVPASRFRKFVRDLTCRIITESFMVLTFPRGLVLALSRHLEYACPEILASVDDEELNRLLELFEPKHGLPDDCGAKDWSDLQHRMHFIVHLFRSFHEREELFDPPFSSEQLQQILNGTVPEGDL